MPHDPSRPRKARGLPAVTLFMLLPFGSPAAAQETAVQRIVSQPERLVLRVGEVVPFSVQALDAEGRPLEAELLVRGSRAGVAVDVGDAGRIAIGLDVGEHSIVVTLLPGPDSQGPGPSLVIPVDVTWPSIDRVEIEPVEGRLYARTHVRYRATGWHLDGSVRRGATVNWTTSNPSIATVDRFGRVSALTPGEVRIIAEVDGVRGERVERIEPLPAERLTVDGSTEFARTGDVVLFDALATTADGAAVSDLPLVWSYTYVPDDTIGVPGATAIVEGGRFVAEWPGVYTVWASAGPLSGFATVKITGRDVVQRLEVLGQGRMSHRRTSDFWVWEGLDGRDYAVTGTWGSDGFTYFWDVTEPQSIVLVDSIQVDARTVNDVKVSPDGRYASLTREGASNRRNGVVIIDLSDPRRPEIATEFDEGLTGGVHNAFPMDDYLYVLSAGEKYLIVDMADIRNPRTVGEVNLPGSRIHDVWVHDGIAYSAEWRTGVVMTDVGNGRWGGSPENPVVVTTHPLPGGNTHAVFPYYQESTGRFYIFAGDEVIGRRGFALEGGTNRAPWDPEVPGSGTPRNTAGYIHIVDFTDPENPRKVARYHVPEYGTHNIWVEDDVLYQAYYEGGLRVVDVSGLLMGNLYTQGREIAVFKPNDPIGYVANAPTTWSAMPFKGNIFVSDANSGLWSARLLPREQPIP